MDPCGVCEYCVRSDVRKLLGLLLVLLVAFGACVATCRRSPMQFLPPPFYQDVQDADDDRNGGL